MRTPAPAVWQSPWPGIPTCAPRFVRNCPQKGPEPFRMACWAAATSTTAASGTRNERSDSTATPSAIPG